MATLYVRDAPDEVVAELKQMAADADQSLSAFVAAHLDEIVKRERSRRVVDELLKMDRTGFPTTQEILETLHESREGR